jgi:hypothetical protein
MADTTASHRRDWFWFAIVLAMYAYPFAHFEILRSPNELSRLYQVRAIVDDGTVAVNGPVERYGSMGDLSEFEGRMYPNKAPGISFLGAGVYAVVKLLAGGAEQVTNRGLLYFLRLLCCALPTALLVIPLRRYAARVSGDERAALAATLTYAFGSLAFTYGTLFFSHQLAAVLLGASFLALEYAKRRSGAQWLVLGGLSAAYAVVVEYTAAPVAAALGIYVIATQANRVRGALLFAAGAIPCAFVLMAYHNAAYGSPLATGYTHVQNQVFKSWHEQGFMGVSTPRLTSLLGNLFSTGRGLFAFAPAFLIALPGLWWMRTSNRADARLTTFVLGFYCFLAASFLYQAWGWMLGPRHLTPLMPFLVAPLAVGIARLREMGWLGGVAGGLCAASIVITGVGTVVYPHIPEEFSGAIAHLIWPLLSNGYLPYNVAEMVLGRVAIMSWVPWFLGLGLIADVVLRGCLAQAKWALVSVLVIVAMIAVLFLAPPQTSGQEMKTRQWIIRTWEPTPANVKQGWMR